MDGVEIRLPVEKMDMLWTGYSPWMLTHAVPTAHVQLCHVYIITWPTMQVYVYTPSGSEPLFSMLL